MGGPEMPFAGNASEKVACPLFPLFPSDVAMDLLHAFVIGIVTRPIVSKVLFRDYNVAHLTHLVELPPDRISRFAVAAGLVAS